MLLSFIVVNRAIPLPCSCRQHNFFIAVFYVVDMAFRCRVFMSSLLLGVVCLLLIKGNCLSSLSLQSFMRDDTPIL
ncbi:hypothetical protein AtNW77_Chr1g0048051 [Arabidopsis thaliana]